MPDSAVALVAHTLGAVVSMLAAVFRSVQYVPDSAVAPVVHRPAVDVPVAHTLAAVSVSVSAVCA